MFFVENIIMNKDTVDYTKLSDSIISQTNKQSNKTLNDNPSAASNYANQSHSGFCKTMLAVGSAITFIRNLVLNTLFIIILLLAIIGIKACDTLVENNEEVQKITALSKKSAPVLYLNLSGSISDAPEPTDGYAKLAKEIEKSLNNTSSTDVLSVERALQYASKDNSVKEIFVDLSNLYSVSFSSASRIATAIKNLKKLRPALTVTSYSNSYTKGAFIIANACDKIVLHPLGNLNFKGMSLSNLYFKDALETYGIKPLVIKAGEYKSAVEPLTSNKMSDDVREEYQGIVNGLWDVYLYELPNRHLNKKLKALFSNEQRYLDILSKYDGDEAKMLLMAEVVDELNDKINLTHEYAKKYSVSKIHPSSVYVMYDDYLKYHDNNIATNKKSTATVAVIYGIGTITDHSDNKEAFTPANIKEQLKKAEKIKDLKTLIFYINSGGGSVTASESIRAMIKDFKFRRNVRIIVSMNSIAASGAYWISTAADEIYATDDTITGSIGVFAVIPDVHVFLNEHGVYHDGVSTSEFENYSIAKQMPEENRVLYTYQIMSTYRHFLTLVKHSKYKLRLKNSKDFAEGKIFLANDAMKLGLVDHIGNLNQILLKEKRVLSRRKHPNVKVVHISAGEDNGMSLIKTVLTSKAYTYIPDEYLKLTLDVIKRAKEKPNVQKGLMAISPVNVEFN